tara:strand:+ start:2306 stop:2617 length:312 start_codon:yes stop_codon:yes gene_type:complete
MNWISILIAGLITYFTRMIMITFFKKEIIGKKFKLVLSYVPAVVFPVIIFPGIFYDDYGNLVGIFDPKIFGALIAALIGIITQNVLATIIAGLFSYWAIIFLI